MTDVPPPMDWPPFQDIPPEVWDTLPDFVARMRADIYQRSWRPVPVYGCEVSVPSPGKQPAGGDGWDERARRDPPPCCTVAESDDRSLNTGILCDDLRAVDIDCDDPNLSREIRALMEDHLGKSPCVRSRFQSPRLLAVYAAAVEEPRSTKLGTPGRMVEVLGRGRQFVAVGWHPSGTSLRWENGGAPGWIARRDLPTAPEQAVEAFLRDAADLIGTAAPAPPRARVDDWKPDHPFRDPTMPIDDVRACLDIISNTQRNYDRWVRVGMAIWSATGGSWEGLMAWSEWGGGLDRENLAPSRWRNFARGGVRSLGAGTLVYEARQHDPGFLPPSRRLPPVERDDIPILLAAIRAGRRKR